jgi:periplasmic divalent cation tolerance protein
MTDHRLLLTTAGTEEEARRIAHGLVERRLAACVNVVPRIASVYRWQEKIEEAEEWLLMIKTTEAAFARVCEGIQELHSYELPECIGIPITAGSPAYLKWIEDSVD